MAAHSLDDARRALASGRPESAVELAWRAVRPAVIAQDVDFIRQTMHLADEVASQCSGPTSDDAEKLSSYCAACIVTPRDTQPSPWSLKRLLAFRTDDTRACPDCAERIKAEARVCRFCGYRYPSPQL